MFTSRNGAFPALRKISSTLLAKLSSASLDHREWGGMRVGNGINAGTEDNSNAHRGPHTSVFDNETLKNERKKKVHAEP